MRTLQDEFDDICWKYAERFAEKHDILYKDNFWVNDICGGIYVADSYYVDFDSMRYDIDNNIPEEE